MLIRRRYSAILLSMALSPLAHALITNTQISSDQKNIYFKFTENKAHSYYHVYIDSDNNAKSGFSIKGIGADRLLENAAAWKSTGKTWGWTKIIAVPFTNSNSNLSWTMPLNILGVPLQCGVPIKVLFSAEGGGLADDFSSVINYTLNVGACGGVISNPTATATDTSFTFSYQVSSAQSVYRVYFDTDGSASTGYPVGTIGANYKLEGSNLYTYAQGSWVLVKSEPFTVSGNTVTWTIGRNDLGNRDCAGSLVYLAAVQNTGSETLANKATFTYASDPNCSAPPPSSMHIAVPAYFDPCSSSGCNWDLVNHGAPAMNIAIINPNSGPGGQADSAYVTQTRTTQGFGASVVGYVHTSYGARSISAVESEIDQYYSWYKVDGIFLDEVSDNCTTQTYYQNIYNYIKAKGGKAIDILNPGTTVPQCFASLGDILVTYEGDYNGYNSWQAAGWETTYPASKFWHIVYNAPANALSSLVSLAKQRKIGYVYLTSLTLDQNPYGAMPASSYWNTEVSLVNATLRR